MFYFKFNEILKPRRSLTFGEDENLHNFSLYNFNSTLSNIWLANSYKNVSNSTNIWLYRLYE